MKILLATPLYPPQSGGPSTYAKLLVDELPKRGIDVVLVKFGDVRHLPSGIRHAAYFFNCLFLGRKVDLIYALDPVSVGLPASWAAKMLGKKFMLRVPGDFVWEQGRQRFGVQEELDEFQTKTFGKKVERLRRVQQKVANSAAKIVVPSEYMRRVVSGWMKNKSKVEVIYSSIHMPVVFELPKDRPDGFLVVTIARRVPWKGVEALEKVVGQEKVWHFKLLADLPHKEAMGWVKAADVFALNSTYEGLSHALVEAMSLGTPVVATNVGGNPELIESGENGILIPPKDNESLYKALKEIEQNKEAAKARAQSAMEKTKQFSSEVAIEKLVQLLKHI